MDQQLNQQNQKVMPSSYLALSIIASFFCWPFAIPAIINASKVESLWYQGQYNEAVEAYNKKVLRFPGRIFASIFGFDKKEMFKADEGARQAPKVEF